MSQSLRQRPNLVDARGEHWKPPTYPKATGPLGHLRARLLRFIDLQSGTIWKDLAQELPKASGTVVDVGCGLQPFRGLFPPGVNYVGIDRAETRNEFAEAAPDTRYYEGDRWPLDDGFADFILCTETLEHVREPAPFLAEMARCLKPGGRALLTIPFAARWHFIPHDYWRPTPSALAALFAAAGFTNVGVYGRGNQLTVACYKGMGVVFSLLAPRPAHPALGWLSRGVGALGIPMTLLLALVANVSTRWPGSVDFLGFTIVAEKPAASKQ
jgi:SAM-dependent methyltransferase